MSKTREIIVEREIEVTKGPDSPRSHAPVTPYVPRSKEEIVPVAWQAAAVLGAVVGFVVMLIWVLS